MNKKSATTSALGKRLMRLSKSHLIIEKSQGRKAIIDEVIPGAELERVACLCGDADADEIELALIDIWGLPARTVLCVSCGLIRVSPRWSEDTYNRLYAGYYWKLHVGVDGATQKRFNLSLRRAAAYADFLKSQVDLRKKDILEIGCSWGAGLQQLTGLDLKLTGYDFDKNLLKIGREKTGLDLRYGGIDEAVKSHEQFDLVITRHVLEHFLHPVAELNQLKRLLKPGGLLFVEVPGVFNCPADPVQYFNVFHTYSYSKQTLTNLMNSSGFKRVFCDEHIYSLWEVATEPVDVQWADPERHKKILESLLEVEAAWVNSHKFRTRVINKLKNIYKKI